MNTHTVPADDLDRLHILLVDNNPVALEQKAFLLEHFGCLVTCSTNGIEANVLIKAHPGLFDIVMADYSVTGMGEIKSVNSQPDTPVFLYLDKNAFIDENFINNMSFRSLN